MTDDGLVTIPSAFAVAETARRLEAALQTHDVTLFARIDHAAGAAAAGLPLRPTLLLIFGNARAGTPLMQADQRIGIDLPLKALIWQDADDKVWLTYTEPAWIAARHQLGQDADKAVAALGKALAVLARSAASA
ncbi:hypothetical protein CR492_02920 [Methylocella silvestris]|uniref:DUF302 domain-containing protein n=1 Tax=Methylocella silvestris TaxID=199596 RepID=A0A2J7TMR3_METSI|nr:hypothetical protein CR492_02920 [Methylocella silvestris]